MEKMMKVARMDFGHNMLGDGCVTVDAMLEKQDNDNDVRVERTVRAVVEHVLGDVDETKSCGIKDVAIEQKMRLTIKNQKTEELIVARVWAEDVEQAELILKKAVKTLHEPTEEERKAAKDWS